MPMPTGRMEKRIAKTVILQICLYDEPGLKERTITENGSPRGARVLVERESRLRQAETSFRRLNLGKEHELSILGTTDAWLHLSLGSICALCNDEVPARTCVVD